MNSDGKTHVVGTSHPNAWGSSIFMVMSPNGASKCSCLSGGTVVDPQGPRHGQARIVRGGSWQDTLELGRTAARASASPEERPDSRGFRFILIMP